MGEAAQDRRTAKLAADVAAKAVKLSKVNKPYKIRDMSETASGRVLSLRDPKKKNAAAPRRRGRSRRSGRTRTPPRTCPRSARSTRSRPSSPVRLRVARARARPAPDADPLGDVWRGTLTSCHQTQYHTKRRYRYFPVELSIDRVDRDSGEITATFVTHMDHSRVRGACARGTAAPPPSSAV